MDKTQKSIETHRSAEKQRKKRERERGRGEGGRGRVGGERESPPRGRGGGGGSAVYPGRLFPFLNGAGPSHVPEEIVQVVQQEVMVRSLSKNLPGKACRGVQRHPTHPLKRPGPKS